KGYQPRPAAYNGGGHDRFLQCDKGAGGGLTSGFDMGSTSDPLGRRRGMPPMGRWRRNSGGGALVVASSIFGRRWRAAMRLRLIGSARRLLMITAIIAVVLAPVAARCEYLLAPGDVLEIEIVGFRDFRQRVMIDLNGQASFPLIGDIKAAGL